MDIAKFPAAPRNFAATLLVVLAACFATSAAADDKWVKVQTERFGVVSQLTPEATLRWAVEFDQFIDALHQFHKFPDSRELPPLTVVMFAQDRDFAPYRMQTASGQAKVAGFFSNVGSWSVIGLPGQSRWSDERHTIYHEAVHWFASAEPASYPLWFQEGLAEVYSTFEVKKGIGRWGLHDQNNVDLLNYYGLLPLQDFFRMSQDQSLHGSPKYYPVAWTFVHYLMFANESANAPKLAEFLRLQRETDLDTAFTTAFGKSYDEMSKELRAYLQRGRHAIINLPVRDRSLELEVTPASSAQVEFALARVAYAGGNDELARKHVDAVLAVAPNSADVHGMLALIAARSGDAAAAKTELDRAIELGSQDSVVYAASGWRLIRQDSMEQTSTIAVSAATARAAADHFDKAIALRPQDARAYEGLVLALLNVDTVTDQDSAALALGRRTYPTNGWLLVGEASVARQRDDVPAALEALRRARAEPFTLESRQRPFVRNLHDNWLIEWVSGELQTLVPAGKFAEAHALLDAQLAEESLAAQPRKSLSSMKAEVSGVERIQAALATARVGNGARRQILLAEIAADSTETERTRREAQRLLDRIAPN